MSPELIYFLKVNVAIVLFYAFYRLFCCKDTFFAWRRVMLLTFLGISFLYPLFDIQEWVRQQEPMNGLAMFYANAVMPEILVQPETPDTSYTMIILNTLCCLYICGVILLAIRFFVQLASISLLAFRSKGGELNGVKVRFLKHQTGPFSFFRWIFIHPQSLTEGERKEVLAHEQTHVRQYHSADVVLSELVCMVCWVNPFVWLLKQEIRHNLEYMADNKVIRSGYDSKSYQYHLLGLAHHKAAANIYNNFNVLPIKNRIMMMNKKRTKSIGRTKYMMFLPLAALLMLVSNIEAVARIGSEITGELFQNKPVVYQGIVLDEFDKPLAGVNVIIQNTNIGTITDKDGRFKLEADPSQTLWFSFVGKAGMLFPLNKATGNDLKIRLTTEVKEYKGTGVKETKTFERDGEIFEQVEVLPEYPGGMQACFKFLSDNIKYPENAMKNKIEGRVIVSFTVDKDGSVIKPEIVRSVDPELDAEALRVMTLMPKWKPGMQRGEVVAVKYTIPVSFALSKEPSVPNDSPMAVGPAPLFLVDGVKKDFKELGEMKPESIEKIEVLKDKAATDLYGEEGKNGVIIVTMKKTR